MDFKTPQNVNDANDEATRQLAESRKLNLTPIHEDLVPDARPESEEVARNVNGPAIANAPNDTEQTTAPVQPSRSVLKAPSIEIKRRGAISLIVIGGVTVVAVAATGLYLFIK